MKHLFRLFLGLIIIFLFQFNARGADPFRIGIFDVKIIQYRSKSFQKTRAILKKKLDALQKKINKEKAELTKIEEEFKKQRKC